MENIKVKIQIIGEEDKVLISSTINNSTIKTAKELHGVNILEDIYNSLLEDLEKTKSPHQK
jgi:hypothetical protein